MKAEYNYQIGTEIKTVTVEPDGHRFQVTVGDKVYNVAAQGPNQGQLNLELEGRQWQIHVARNKSRYFVAMAGETWVLERPQARSGRRGPGASALAGSGQLEASMPGLVLDVCVAESDRVERGQTLVLLEAMKMELRISAPCAGQISHVHCTTGQVVERGQILVELEPD
jgi:biotin carboxyl carrier protein